MAAAFTRHAFDVAVELKAHADGRYTGHTHDAYANMVGPFGGVIGATLLNAVMVAFATAVTGIGGETWEPTDATFPTVPPAARLTPAAPRSPAPWTSRYDMRFIDGAIEGPTN